MEDTLRTIGNTLNIEVFMEDDITRDDGNPLPGDINSIDPRVVLERVLKGYSYAVLFDDATPSKVWVYKKGKGPFVRVSQLEEGIETGADISINAPIPVSGGGKTNTITRASPVITYDRGVKKSRTGINYKKNAFGYKKPILSPISAKNNPSLIHSGAYTYKAFKKNKEKAEQDKLMSQTAMMRQLR
ncbi:MAG: hypothetical protein U9P49_07185, partial [Thermodesulfobacteriota bacterium]|nr:hypothetical protein [Thermodesulfobacteriota bacterium]